MEIECNKHSIQWIKLRHKITIPKISYFYPEMILPFQISKSLQWLQVTRPAFSRPLKLSILTSPSQILSAMICQTFLLKLLEPPANFSTANQSSAAELLIPSNGLIPAPATLLKMDPGFRLDGLIFNFKNKFYKDKFDVTLRTYL